MTDPTNPAPPAEELRACYLLVKRGLYYGPNNQGYTGVKDRAGRYLATEADPESGVSAVHEDEAPMFSPACWEDVKVSFLLDHLSVLTVENERMRAAINAIVGEEAVYLTSSERDDEEVAIWPTAAQIIEARQASSLPAMKGEG